MTRLGVLLALAIPGGAAAQVALYGAQPPPGAGFIRFVSAVAGEITVKADFMPPQTLGPRAADRVGPYVIIDHAAGRRLDVSIEAASQQGAVALMAEPGGYRTVIVQPSQAGGVNAVTVADAAEFNQARARLVFYNATAACADGSLALLPGATTIFAGVAPGAARARGVTPVAAELRAGCAGAVAPDFALTGLEVGGSYSVWLMQPDDPAIAFITRDRTLPYAP